MQPRAGLGDVAELVLDHRAKGAVEVRKGEPAQARDAGVGAVARAGVGDEEQAVERAHAARAERVLAHGGEDLGVVEAEVRGEARADVGVREHRIMRFDLVEREQVGRILDELKLEATALVGAPDGQREVTVLRRV